MTGYITSLGIFILATFYCSLSSTNPLLLQKTADADSFDEIQNGMNVSNMVTNMGFVPLAHWVDVTWDMENVNSDLEGCVVTWRNKSSTTLAQCFIDCTQDGSYDTESCRYLVDLMPCDTSMIVIVMPVGHDGRATGVGNSHYAVTGPDENNMACDIELYPHETWISLRWMMLFANYGPVSCHVTWQDRSGSVAAECLQDCSTDTPAIYIYSGWCDNSSALVANSTYNITVQPLDENQENVGVGASAVGMTRPENYTGVVQTVNSFDLAQIEKVEKIGIREMERQESKQQPLATGSRYKKMRI